MTRQTPPRAYLPGGQPIDSVLFVCTYNAVRSPMAEALLKQMAGMWIYVDSCGVESLPLDPFAAAALQEQGVNLSTHRPKLLHNLQDGSFDLVVALSPEAHEAAEEVFRASSAAVEYWPMPDVSRLDGTREQRMEHYRGLRDALRAAIARRFATLRGPAPVVR